MDRVIGNYTAQENRSFPLDCEALEAIQNNIDMLGALGNMVGDKTILSGCQPQTGGGRTEGYVYLKTVAYPMGEVLHFVGSSEESDYLHLVTTNTSVTQDDVTYNSAYTTRQVAQGKGEEQWVWAELSEPVDIEAIAAELRQQMTDLQTEMAKIQQVPLGVVEMYSGSTIPDNYAVCNGQELSQTLYADLYKVIGTRFNKATTASGNFCLPDLSGRFIVGQDGSDNDFCTIGNTGGEKTHALTAEETPLVSHTHKHPHTHDLNHTHSYNDVYYSENGGSVYTGGLGSGETDSDNAGYDMGRTTGGPSNKTTTAPSDENTKEPTETHYVSAHENCPPYFVLFYIMRLK